MKQKLLFFLIPFLIFSLFIFKDINLPFVGPNATNFTVYSLIAHNFNQFGYLNTKLTPLISVSKNYPKTPQYFFHHPTLLSFSESILFKIFGEKFWVGRLTVILYSFGSLFLIYLLSKKLFNKQNLAVISTLIFAIIPASTLFGKMIGQEPLVLFFCLLTLNFSLDFLKNKNNKYLILSILSLILGIFSDWPTIIFVFALFPIFKTHKNIKAWLYLLLTTIFVLAFSLIYIYTLNSGFSDLKSALLHRGITGLLHIQFWPIIWITTLVSRILIYFNPIIFLPSLVFLYEVYKKGFKKISKPNSVILALFIFPVLHVLLYMQASYTHYYLIYYFLPFVTLSFSLIIFKLLEKKKYLYILLIFIFSLTYLIGISLVKNNQNRANVFRFSLAQKISNFIPKYETVGLNSGDVLDTDLLWYPFLINWEVTKTTNLDLYKDKYNFYIYTCVTDCKGYEIQMSRYKKEYSYVRVIGPNSETYLFSLTRKYMLNNQTFAIQKSQDNNEQLKKLLKSLKIW